MDLKDYPIVQEEKYDAMAERLNLLAEILANAQTSQNLPKSKELNQHLREVLRFFKRLV